MPYAYAIMPCLAALLLTLGCTEPEAGPDRIVILPPDAAVDAGPADVMVDAALADMDRAPDADPPERRLIARPALPFATQEHVLNPTFDPRSPGAWLVIPQEQGARIADHRLPFGGAALVVQPTDEPPQIYGRLKLSAEPLVSSIWVGLEGAPGEPPEEVHPGRVLPEIVAFTPDRDQTDPIVYGMSPTDEIVQVDAMVWRRYEGGFRRPTLGWGWFIVRSDGVGPMGLGAPSITPEPLDPSALRHRPPEMKARPIDPALRARLDAFARPPAPRPRPTAKGPFDRY